jgi:hypothetical protein
MNRDTTNDLFVTDAEVIRRLGVSEKVGRVAIRELERRPGFPRKDPLFGGRRFWPAVTAFLAKRYGLATIAPSPPDGPENFDAIDRPTGQTPRHRRARLAMARSDQRMDGALDRSR